MNREVVIESGLQVFSRLFNRPSLEDLDNDLFFKKVGDSDIIEIKGLIGCGVPELLTKFVAKCILPLQYEGLGSDVLFINSENQFQVSKLHDIIKSQIRNILGPINVDEYVENVLMNLKLMNCYNHYQFFLTLNSLDDILLKYRKVSLIIIDSISTHYWQQQDDLSYDSYVKKILNIIKKITDDLKVVVLYTKQFNFESKKKTIDWYERKKILNYEISLNKTENSADFICNIESGNDKRELYYKINEFYFLWITQENKKSI